MSDVYIKIKMDEKEVKLKSSTLNNSNLAMIFRLDLNQGIYISSEEGEIINQWSDLAILLFAKNTDDENEKCLKIKVFLCISHSKLKKGYLFFNFHSPS